MQAAIETSKSRRRSLRRAVRVEAEVASPHWEGRAPFVATNVSAHGLWLDTDLALEVGDELLVSLTPPRWDGVQPLTALARVARVGFYRRRSEAQRSGMGLCFVGLAEEQVDKPARSLEGFPPPLSRRRGVLARQRTRAQARRSSDRTERVRPSVDELLLPHVVLADGSRYGFRAIGELLTAGRGPATEHEAARGETQGARVIPITSPMTAILTRFARAS